jgi:hypothetical protein
MKTTTQLDHRLFKWTIVSMRSSPCMGSVRWGRKRTALLDLSMLPVCATSHTKLLVPSRMIYPCNVAIAARGQNPLPNPPKQWCGTRKRPSTCFASSHIDRSYSYAPSPPHVSFALSCMVGETMMSSWHVTSAFVNLYAAWWALLAASLRARIYGQY